MISVSKYMEECRWGKLVEDALMHSVGGDPDRFLEMIGAINQGCADGLRTTYERMKDLQDTTDMSPREIADMMLGELDDDEGESDEEPGTGNGTGGMVN